MSKLKKISIISFQDYFPRPLLKLDLTNTQKNAGAQLSIQEVNSVQHNTEKSPCNHYQILSNYWDCIKNSIRWLWSHVFLKFYIRISTFNQIIYLLGTPVKHNNLFNNIQGLDCFKNWIAPFQALICSLRPLIWKSVVTNSLLHKCFKSIWILEAIFKPTKLCMDVHRHVPQFYLMLIHSFTIAILGLRQKKYQSCQVELSNLAFLILHFKWKRKLSL